MPTSGTDDDAASRTAQIRQCDRCRLFLPLDDFTASGALDKWRACRECRDLVFPRPFPIPSDDRAN